MSECVRSASYAASQELLARGLRVTRSHLGEINAALLGYATYAALLLEARDPAHRFCLDDADVIVLDPVSGANRASELLQGLGTEEVSQVVSACRFALAETFDNKAFFDSVDEMFDNWAEHEIASMVIHAENLDPRLARVLGAPACDGAWHASDPLWQARDEWVIETKGTICEADEDGAEIYGGAKLSWQGRMVFHKAGRAGLIVDTLGASCQPAS